MNSFHALGYIQKKNIIIYEKKDTPLVRAKFVFTLGNEVDKYGGELYLLSRILNLSKLSHILENAGSTLDVQAEYDFLSIEFELLSKFHFDVLKKIINYLRRFKITQKEFELSKNRLLQELKLKKDEFYHVVRYRFYKELYGNHRYAKPITGTGESISKISLNDINNLFQKLLNRNIVKLLLVGDVNQAEIDDYNELIDLFPSKKIKLKKTEVMNTLKKVKKVFVKEDSTQVFVRIGTFGIKRNDPHFLEYYIISNIIGGGFGSVIMEKLREEKGLTYTPVGNFYSYRKDKGYFFIAYSTQKKNLKKSLKIVKNIFKNLRKKGIPFKNFKFSCQYLFGVMLQAQETNADIVNLLTGQVVFNLQEQFWLKNRNKLAKIISKNEQIVSKFGKRRLRRMNLEKISNTYRKVNSLIKDFFKNNKFVYVILKP